MLQIHASEGDLSLYTYMHLGQSDCDYLKPNAYTLTHA